MQQLTKRQSEIYHFLQQHFHELGHTPSIDDVCQAMGMKSRGSMHKHIHALIDAGLVEPFNGKKRGIHLISTTEPTDNKLVHLPLLGKIAAGIPFEAIANPDTLGVPEHLCGRNECFVLIVKGESMIDAGIQDSDQVIIEKTSEVKNGDIVVALIDNTEATLKRWEKTDDLVILHPENASMKAMIFNPQRISIQGKLIALLRRYL